jgi:hypothetical protein
MKSIRLSSNHGLSGLLAALLGLLPISAAHAQIFVANFYGDSVGEYNLDGSTVNASLISGLDNPEGIAVSGSDLFVTNSGNGTIGEYTTSGATVNASLITGQLAGGMVVSGSDLFVTAGNGGSSIAEYTTSGAIVNASFVMESGSEGPEGIVVVPQGAPEPLSWTLLLVELFLLALWRRRFRRTRV